MSNNFFPAYMDGTVKLPENCEGRYNKKHLIGMLYVEGYKDNPIHITAKSEDELFEKMKDEAALTDRFMRDSDYMRRSCARK